MLKQAWTEGVRPVLVLNKLDRLICETQMSPTEAYQHIARILEEVNVIVSSLFTAELLAAEQSDDVSAVPTAKHETAKAMDGDTKFKSWAIDLDERKESSLFFSPAKGNVVFTSAIDGWAFEYVPLAQVQLHL